MHELYVPTRAFASAFLSAIPSGNLPIAAECPMYVRPLRMRGYRAFTFLYAPDGRMVASHTAAADWSDPSVITFIDQRTSR